jgi:hypothetical protein
MNSLKTLAALAFALVFYPAPGPAQTIIGSLPYPITTAGTYVLNESLSYPSAGGIAITVKASNVTINLNGHAITNTSDPTTTQAIGIGEYNVENLTIENGEILGFLYGVYLHGPPAGPTIFNFGHVLQGLRLSYCAFAGIYLQYAYNCLIQNCQLSAMGYTSQFQKVADGNGIVCFNNLGTRIYRCQVVIAHTGFVGGGLSEYWEQNLAMDCDSGFAFGDSREVYRDNASVICPTPFSGGTDFGGNHSR